MSAAVSGPQAHAGAQAPSVAATGSDCLIEGLSVGLVVHSLVETLGPSRRDVVSPLTRRALLAAIESGSHAVCLFDEADRLAYCNDAFRRGWAMDDSRGVTFDSMIRNCYRTRRGAIIKTDDIEAWLIAARRGRRDGPADRAFEVDLWDGRWMWLTERRMDDGWLLFIAQDITPLKQSERILRMAHDAAVEASLTDALTHLPNRRHAMQAMEESIRRQDPFNVALIDIDSFKQINDRYGHAAGDDLLSVLGRELGELTNHDCFVARLAGDEFLVMSNNVALRTFERRLLDLLQHRGDHAASGDPAQTFGVSIGASRFPDHGTNARQLLSAADEAMYRAKSMGGCALQCAPLP